MTSYGQSSTELLINKNKGNNMADAAKYIRIFKNEPDDEFVTKRIAAIKAISDGYTKVKNIDALFSIANDLVSAIPDVAKLGDNAKDMAIKALKKQSSSFTEENQELQISTCALIAALNYIEGIAYSRAGGITVGDVFGLALWSGLSFKSVAESMPKLDELRSEILMLSQKLVLSDSLSSREREVVPSLTAIQVPDGTTLSKYSEDLLKSLESFVGPMRRNAVLDREELDVLWWLLNGYSKVTNSAFERMNDVQRVIVSGLELPALLRRIPSNAHRRMILGKVDDDTSFNAEELIAQLENFDGDILRSYSSRKEILECPEIFPLLTLLTKKSVPVSASTVRRTLSEWSGRALLEGAMLNLGNYIGDDK